MPAVQPAQVQSVRPIVGMEIHVELATRTKMFSRAPSPASGAHDEAPPNSHIDPVVLGLPGALPVMNRAAVELAAMVGIALGCQIAPLTRWDRKSYFYPDLPKGYQISQYDLPLCFDGVVDLPALDDKGLFVLDAADRAPAIEASRIGIIRAHLEEDAGKLMHEAPGGHAIDFSIADYNRAGTALLEIVTQPDFRSADQAVAFARLLRNTCRFLGVSEGIMQKGHMRFEPNINCELVLEDGRLVRTPIVEIKNLNSFKALKGAIEFELAEQPHRWRQDLREMGRGMKITRGWDDARQVTTVQREKEDAHDYRYFPDPDLAPVAISGQWQARIAVRIPELPLARLRRYVSQYALNIKEATALVEERDTCLFYERCIAELSGGASPESSTAVGEPEGMGVEQVRAGRLAANLLLQNGLKRANERGVQVHELGIHPREIAHIGRLREDGRISAGAADELFGVLCGPREGEGAAAGPAPADVGALAARRGLFIVRNDAQMDGWIDRVLAANPQVVEQIRAGKAQAIGRLVGETMKLAGGSADAKTVRELIQKKIG